ncbi:questin oxidase family protein [Solimicrobium silvestre]|uniref:Questin oxidase family protein n=1 Tax=Solimicrobium silvestre TaxID=2099400 RepID=A0A2S9H1F2_9BURK|nr:questin oxidase family protein [Solimicrobium silvestre]PRC93814.1 hypothetical protein S2091_1423 [Solimicrobium silvestre]
MHIKLSTLGEMLESQSSFLLDPEGFSNHGPMVLIALAKMGASEQQLRTYLTNSNQENRFHSELAQAKKLSITQQTWPQQLNQTDNFSQLQIFFKNWITQTSADQVLIEVLNQIPAAPASVAFHAIIRLAYGLEVNHSGEIAAGLAALVVGNLPISIEFRNKEPAANVLDGLAALSTEMKGFDTQEINITDRIRAVVADPRFARTVPAMPLHDDLLDEMAKTAIVIYSQTHNFTALHMVTGLHAARLVFSRLPISLIKQFMPSLWLAYCAAYASIGAPQIAPKILTAEPTAAPSKHLNNQPWEALFAQTLNSQRDHMIKMIYTCHQEYLRDPSPLYLDSANAILAS